MANQKDSGKAFEYALITEAKKILELNASIKVIKDNSYLNAKNSFLLYDRLVRRDYTKAAKVAIDHIISLEPKLKATGTNRGLLELKLMPDSAGKSGDVRDVLFIRSNRNWEIGISAKNNHSALKHSRLSQTIDFGSEWTGIKCSKTYFANIAPIFRNLARLKSKGIRWSSVKNKSVKVYKPLLDAFLKELLLINKKNKTGSIPEKLTKYLLGRNDFYKIIKRKKVVEILAFNSCGTLNRGDAKFKRVVKRLNLPSKIIDFNYKSNSKTTLQLFCDKGWSMSFRIHSAKGLVEASLKFDVNLIGHPHSMYSHHLRY